MRLALSRRKNNLPEGGAVETAQGEGTTEAGAGGRPALPCGRGCIRSLCGPPFRARAQHQEGMLRPFLIPPGKSQEAAPRKKPSRLSTVRALYSWSLCPELNWRPHPYQGCALPTELQRHGAPNAFCVSDEEAFSLIRPLRQAFFPHFFPPGTGRVRCRAQRRRKPSPAAWRRIPFPADRGPRGAAFRCARQGGRRA